MIPFVNKRSGLIFLVADERKDFYLEAGHKLASEVSQKPKETEVEPEPKEEEKPKAVRAKKTTAKPKEKKR